MHLSCQKSGSKLIEKISMKIKSFAMLKDKLARERLSSGCFFLLKLFQNFYFPVSFFRILGSVL